MIYFKIFLIFYIYPKTRVVTTYIKAKNSDKIGQLKNEATNCAVRANLAIRAISVKLICQSLKLAHIPQNDPTANNIRRLHRLSFR
jgi:hypothetical protein